MFEVSRKFQRSFKKVLKILQKVSGLFPGSLKGVSRKFPEWFKEVLRKFQECFKEVSGKYHGYFKNFHWCFNFD